MDIITEKTKEEKVIEGTKQDVVEVETDIEVIEGTPEIMDLGVEYTEEDLKEGE